MWYWYVIVGIAGACFGFGLACLLNAASCADCAMERDLAADLLARLSREEGEA